MRVAVGLEVRRWLGWLWRVRLLGDIWSGGSPGLLWRLGGRRIGRRRVRSQCGEGAGCRLWAAGFGAPVVRILSR